MKKLETAVVVAWASSKAYRMNHLMSAAQYESCAEKNRTEFDIPLVTKSSLDVVLSDVERLANDRVELMNATMELGGALADVISLLPDPHLDKDQVQAHYVRKAKKVLESHSGNRKEPTA